MTFAVNLNYQPMLMTVEISNEESRLVDIFEKDRMLSQKF
jgi:hypothetical protein